jgi:hypothetical protein
MSVYLVLNHAPVIGGHGSSKKISKIAPAEM